MWAGGEQAGDGAVRGEHRGFAWRALPSPGRSPQRSAECHAPALLTLNLGFTPRGWQEQEPVTQLCGCLLCQLGGSGAVPRPGKLAVKQRPKLPAAGRESVVFTIPCPPLAARAGRELRTPGGGRSPGSGTGRKEHRNKGRGRGRAAQLECVRPFPNLGGGGSQSIPLAALPEQAHKSPRHP